MDYYNALLNLTRKIVLLCFPAQHNEHRLAVEHLIASFHALDSGYKLLVRIPLSEIQQINSEISL